MAFTMHSHSGQFCGHATDQLEDVIQRAIALGFRTIGLSEHMPRGHVEDLYPEEIGSDAQASLAGLAPTFVDYVREAVRLRDLYADKITVLVGFETEWIHGLADDGVRIKALAAGGSAFAGLSGMGGLATIDGFGGFDYFVGSIHHYASPAGSGIPIDYGKAAYAEAVDTAAAAAAAAEAAGSSAASASSASASSLPAPTSEFALYAAYYDQQFDMLQALRPRVVGHFDLVRLLSSDSQRNCETWTEGAAHRSLWPAILRNLRFVASYGGWLECNTAALRKGLAEPYPARPIAEAWLRLGGRFTLSDDSHGVPHVATNYRRGIAYLESLGVQEVWTLERRPRTKADGLGPDTSFDGTCRRNETTVLVEKSISLAQVSASLAD